MNNLARKKRMKLIDVVSAVFIAVFALLVLWAGIKQSAGVINIQRAASQSNCTTVAEPPAKGSVTTVIWVHCVVTATPEGR